MADWLVEPLDPLHERGEFCCGKAPLDDFIRSLASQYEKRKLGRTYVALMPGSRKVCGYYTLASGSIPFADVPPAMAKKLPRHPVPVALLGRLAVDQSAQGQGLGEELLMNALRRCLELSETVGIFAVEVLAIDTQAKGFYEKYGFLPFLDNELHLYLPIQTIEKGLRKKSER